MSDNRYSRQANLPANGGSFNDILAHSSVLICGGGGLGCPAALYLAGAGIGILGIIDYDTINMSNLNRQILYNPSDIGKEKALIAKERIELFNRDTKVTAYTQKIMPLLLDELLPNYNLILDCTDNYQTRMVIAQGAFKHNKPIVIAGVREFEGFVLITRDRASACFGCLYEREPVLSQPPQVLGATAGTLGTLAAAQALLLLTGNTIDSGNMLLLDLAKLDANKIKLEKNPHCTICANK